MHPEPALCSGCSRILIEPIRRPCPACGDTRRTLGRAFAVAVTSEDNVS
jgi:hypothetical protein